jgi:hypothetical protein
VEATDSKTVVKIKRKNSEIFITQIVEPWQIQEVARINKITRQAMYA